MKLYTIFQILGRIRAPVTSVGHLQIVVNHLKYPNKNLHVNEFIWPEAGSKVLMKLNVSLFRKVPGRIKKKKKKESYNEAFALSNLNVTLKFVPAS